MKNRLLLASLLLTTPFTTTATPIEPGQTAEHVLETLGKPIGKIELREKTLLLYPQGEVTIKEGFVSESDLMSEEQFVADQKRLREEREEWLLNQERLREAHKEEGESIRAAKMQSSAFAALPAKDRVDYWRSFQIRYPEVNVSEQIAAALTSYETELEELRSQQRIAELEARMAQTEKETATARLETEKLRKETRRIEQNRYYGLRYYTDPPIHNSRYYYRPPTVTIFTNGKHSKNTHPTDDITYRYDRSQNASESLPDRGIRIFNNVDQ